jgi:hypothetical protein
MDMDNPNPPASEKAANSWLTEIEDAGNIQCSTEKTRVK